MAIKVNTREAVEFKALPKGVHTFKVNNWELEVSKNSGNQQIVFECEVVETEDTDVLGKTKKYYAPIEGKGTGLFVDFMACFGKHYGKGPEEGGEFVIEEEELDNIVGYKFKADISHRPNKDNPKNPFDNFAKLFPYDDEADDFE